MWEVYAQKNEEPEALASKPIVPGFLTIYVEAFSLLSAQRGYTMDGAQAIPISEMVSLYSEYEIEDCELFIRHICVMDRAFRKATQSRKT